MASVPQQHVRSNNSWMHDVKLLVEGNHRCTLLIHPIDAGATGVADGSVARVSSTAGKIEVPVEASDEMMPGVVLLPHGWGHDKPGTRMSIAREHAGVNNNLLAPGTFADVSSGNAAVTGNPVELVPAGSRVTRCLCRHESLDSVMNGSATNNRQPSDNRHLD